MSADVELAGGCGVEDVETDGDELKGDGEAAERVKAGR